MPTTTLSKWTINAGEAHGPKGGNQTALVGCHLAIVEDADGTHYQFQAPGGTAEQTSTGSQLPTLPYTFPAFWAQLGGPTSMDWYIKVKTTTGGQSGNEAKGDWSNFPFPPAFSETDPDTWTAQSGGTGAEGEEDAASSAYA